MRTLIVATLAWMTPQAALACSQSDSGPMELVPGSDDVVAPEQPVLIDMALERSSQIFDDESECNNFAYLDLWFSATDDQSPDDAIGYEISVWQGQIPENLLLDAKPVIDNASEGGVSYFQLVWDDVGQRDEELDFALWVEAVDEAGNRSEPLAVEIYSPGLAEGNDDYTQDPKPVDDPDASGCATVSPSAGLWTLAPAALLLLRRRRA